MWQRLLLEGLCRVRGQLCNQGRATDALAFLVNANLRVLTLRVILSPVERYLTGAASKALLASVSLPVSTCVVFSRKTRKPR